MCNLAFLSAKGSRDKVKKFTLYFRLDDNMEKKEDVNIPLMALYEYYTETCQLQGVNVADVPVFTKVINFWTFHFFLAHLSLENLNTCSVQNMYRTSRLDIHT